MRLELEPSLVIFSFSCFRIPLGPCVTLETSNSLYNDESRSDPASHDILEAF